MTKKDFLKLFFLLFIIFFLYEANANSPQEKRQKYAELVRKELAELYKFLKNEKNPEYSILFKIAESHFENATLIKDELFDQSAQNVVEDIKSPFFIKAKKEFEYSIKYALMAIEKAKSVEDKGKVMAILGLNYIQFKEEAKAEKNFQEALKYLKETHPYYQKITLWMAENYYQKKNFSSAISFYLKALKFYQGKNRPSHLINVGNCFYFLRQFQEAINYYQQGYNDSKKGQYLDNSKAAANKLAVMFLLLGNFEQFFSWTQKESLSPHSLLLETTFNPRELKDLPSFIESKLANEKNVEIVYSFRMIQLIFYHKSYDIENHLLALEKLLRVKIPTQAQELTIVRNQVIDIVSNYKKNLQKNKKDDLTKKRFSLLGRYFLVLFTIEKNPDFILESGEYFFLAQNYEQALNSYQEFLKIIDQKNHKNLSKIILSIEAGLKSLELLKASLETQKYENIILYFYSLFLLFKKSDTIGALIVVEKLIIYHLKKKDLEKSFSFFKYYLSLSSNTNKNEAIGTLLFEEIKKTRIGPEYLKVIEGNKQKFSGKFFEFLARDTIRIDYEKAKEDYSKNNFSQGLQRLENIFKTSSLPSKMASEVAFNASLMAIKDKRSEESYNWLLKTKNLGDHSFLDQNFSALIGIFKEYALLGNIGLAFEGLSHFVSSYCQKKTNKFDVALELAGNFIFLKNPKEFIPFLERLSKCSASPKLLQQIFEKGLRQAWYVVDFILPRPSFALSEDLFLNYFLYKVFREKTFNSSDLKYLQKNRKKILALNSFYKSSLEEALFVYFSKEPNISSPLKVKNIQDFSRAAVIVKNIHSAYSFISGKKSKFFANLLEYQYYEKILEELSNKKDKISLEIKQALELQQVGIKEDLKKNTYFYYDSGISLLEEAENFL